MENNGKEWRTVKSLDREGEIPRESLRLVVRAIRIAKHHYQDQDFRKGEYATLKESEPIHDILCELIERSDLEEVLCCLYMIAEDRGQVEEFNECVSRYNQVRESHAD